MDKRANILYVEDDKTLSFITKDNLEENGYNIFCCEDGQTAIELFKNQDFDLCILDVMLPRLDGFNLAKKIRKSNKDIPIIFVTAKSMKEDKLTGLKLGGDDYITKPFSIEELILKIEIFLKRSKILKEDIHQSKFSIGDYLFDFDDLTLNHKNNTIQLTLKEAEVLRFFCENTGKVLYREEILNSVWKNDDYFSGRSMDVFISRIRKHLNLDKSVRIENIHGIGFKLLIKTSN
ncbi:response regulator transcription factor [Bacteroidota bacterium]